MVGGSIPSKRVVVLPSICFRPVCFIVIQAAVYRRAFLPTNVEPKLSRGSDTFGAATHRPTWNLPAIYVRRDLRVAEARAMRLAYLVARMAALWNS